MTPFRRGFSFQCRKCLRRRCRGAFQPPGETGSRQGAVSTGDAPPILFLSAPKRERAAPGVREKTLLVATLHVRAKLLYGSRRERVPAGLRWLPDGRGGVRYRLDGGFPRRGCALGRGARRDLTSSSFPVSRCGAPRISVTSVPLVPPSARSASLRAALAVMEAAAWPYAETLINHRPAAAKISAACIPDFPGLEGFTRAGRFPL